jgi:hypothetical protein
VPEAITLKVTFEPTMANCPRGCVRMEGPRFVPGGKLKKARMSLRY